MDFDFVIGNAEKKSLKNLQLEELLKLKYSKWLNKKLIVILTKENLFSRFLLLQLVSIDDD